MNSKLKYITTPKGATDLLVWMTWGAPLVSLITSALLRLTSYNPMAYYGVPTIKFFVIILAFSYIIKCYSVKDVAFYLFCIFVCFINYVLFAENELLIEEYGLKFALSTVPLYFIGLIIDFERNEKPLYIISLLCIVLAFFYSFSYMQSDIRQAEEMDYANMYWAYVYLPHVLYVVYYTVKKYNIFRLLFSLAGFFLILSYGSRGPVLCFLLFAAGMLFLYHKFKHPVVSWIIIGLIILLFYLYFMQIVMVLQMLVEMFGMRTRVVDKLIEGELSDSSGRNEYVPILMSHILNGNYFVGYGMCGSWQFIGTYPHNLLLDLWISYGLITGSAFFLIIIVVIINGFKGCANTDEKAFLFLLFVRGFVMLFLSYTYLENSYLYLLMGYCIHLWRRKTARIQVLPSKVTTNP